MKRWWSKLRSPITFNIISYNSPKTFKFHTNYAMLLILVAIFVISLVTNAFLIYRLPDYLQAQKELASVKGQLNQLRSKYQNNIMLLKQTLTKLQDTESKLRSLLKLGNREKIIKHGDWKESDVAIGDVEDVNLLMKEVEKRLASIQELKRYLRRQHSLFMATPRGWPVTRSKAYISSSFGWRINPITHKREFHHGVDVAASEGTPVRSTANGIVVYVGRSRGNGNFVIIEHGYGYATFYAHLKKAIVRVKQWVKRGQIIGYVGHTGMATGPHVHYEVWLHHKRLNPYPFMKKAG